MATPPPADRNPRHLAVIMDGNGRWAQQRRRPRAIGHRAGARAVNLCIDFCLDKGIGALTLFAFSSENWGRPEDDVGALMKLFMNALEREVAELHRRGVRIAFIGERARFGEAIRARMDHAETVTRDNTRLQPGEIDETLFASRVALAGLPPPDLFIRTGGDFRISNFLLWQLAYTDLWFTETLWPALDAATLQRALDDYSSRERRFGLTGSQVAGSPHEVSA